MDPQITLHILASEDVQAYANFTKSNSFHDLLIASLEERKSILKEKNCSQRSEFSPLTLLHSERPKLYAILAFLSAIGLRVNPYGKKKQEHHMRCQRLAAAAFRNF